MSISLAADIENESFIYGKILEDYRNSRGMFKTLVTSPEFSDHKV